jgi:hypothetical protein
LKNLFHNLIKKNSEDAKVNLLGWLNGTESLELSDALKICISHITAILNNDKISINDKLSAILKVDDFNHIKIKNQITVFSKAENLNKETFNAIIDSHYAYERILFLAYSKLIDKSFNQAPNLQPDNDTKAIILMRTMLIASKMLKWRFFNRNVAPLQLWKQANDLFFFANQHLVSKHKTTPYNDIETTSFEKVYIGLFMLGTINFNRLHNHQIELISQAIPHLVADTRIKTTLEKYHSFYVDLDKDKYADRVRSQTPTGKCLFWDLDEAEHKIDNVIEALATNKSSELLNAANISPNYVVLDTFKILKNEWAKSGYKRQRRSETRNNQEKAASVIFSVKEIMNTLKQHQPIGQSAKNLLDGTLSDRRLSTSVIMRGTTNTMFVGKEKWQISDESKAGIGAIILKNHNLKPSKLIGIQNQYDLSKIAIGVIRNCKQLAGDKFKIGIEVLSDKPTVMSMKKLDLKNIDTTTLNQPKTILNQNIPDNVVNNFMAIYLPFNILSDESASIVISKLDFTTNSFYEITYKDKHEIVKLKNVIETGDDWVRVSFPEEIV